MAEYKCYYVDGCEQSKVWQLFQRILLAYSDAFSLIFFRYSTDEAWSQSVSGIYRDLCQYKINEQKVTEWPGTRVLGDRHIYDMVMYRIEGISFEIMDVLERVDTLWKWDYPDYPMDICFYRNGTAWFASSAHEKWNAFYLQSGDDNLPLVSDIESLGVKLEYKGKVTEDQMFHWNGR